VGLASYAIIKTDYDDAGFRQLAAEIKILEQRGERGSGRRTRRPHAHTVRESRAVISGTIDVPTGLPLALGAVWGIEPLPILVFGPPSSVRQNALRYCGAMTYGIVRTLADDIIPANLQAFVSGRWRPSGNGNQLALARV
jgi:hypothetical protein